MTPQVVPVGAAGSGYNQDVAEYDSSIAKTSDLPPESDAAAETEGPEANARFWQQQIQSAIVAERRWRQEAEAAEAAYFGDDQDPGQASRDEATKANEINEKTAFIHANIDVLKPIVYSDTPSPIVTRRWRGDGKSDETDLMAAECGQRLAQFLVSTTSFDQCMERCRDDWLIAGRGTARVLYRATFGAVTSMDPATGAITQEERKASEEVIPSPLEWRRVVFCPGHSWDSLPWLAFEVPMTRTKVEKRFPEYAQSFSFNQKGLIGTTRAPGDQEREQANHMIAGMEQSTEINQSPFDVATVWEIWDRDNRRTVWWSPACPNHILDKAEDPLSLEQFFPCPRPLLATTRGDSLNPRPDVMYYMSRVDEIALAERKMRELLKALALKGLFPGSMADDVKNLFNGEHGLHPVQSWISLMEKGGTRDIIQWLPLDAIVACLNALNLMRESAKQAMYEHSGISDIMRAQGDPRETAMAQRLKGQYAGLRTSIKQRRMAFFARDMLALMMEVALEFFDTERLAEICGLDLPLSEAEREQMIAAAEAQHMQFMQDVATYQQLEQAAQLLQQAGQQVPPLPPPPKEPKPERIPKTSWELVHRRLRDDFARKITLNIETDSTVLADEQADKEARIEFLAAFASFVQQLQPLIASGQFDIRTVKELLLFGVRSFPKSRTLESLIAEIPEEPQGQQDREDTAITVAKIRAETDKMIEEMRLTDSEMQRKHDEKLTGMKMVVDAVKDGQQAPPRPS